MSHGRVKVLSEGQLNSELASAGKRLVVVKFTAVWCPPCKMIAPVYEQLSNQNPDVVFLEVDVDKCKDTARDFGVSAMPTFHFYVENKLVDKFSGANQNLLKGNIEKYKPAQSFSGTGNALGGSSGTHLDGYAARLEALESKNSKLTQEYNTQVGSSGTASKPLIPNAGGAARDEEPNPVMLRDLLEMGFPENRCKKALITVKNSSTEDAMNWIFEHMDDPSIDEEVKTSKPATSTPMDVDKPSTTATTGETNTTTSTSTSTQTNTSEPPTVHNARCDICKEQIIGTRFKCTVCPDYDLCQGCKENGTHCNHEYKAFDKDIENYVMTPEERALAKKRLDDRIQEIRKKKGEDEAKREIEREVSRRASGKETNQAVEKWKEDQAKREAEKIKREKEEDRIAKERIRAKLAQDKLERAAKKSGATATATPVATPTPVVTAPQPVKQVNYTESTIQIKMLDGSTIKGVFPVSAKLIEVYNFVKSNSNQGSFTLANTYPRKIYSSDELQSISVSDAGLVPNGTLISTKK